MIGFFYLVTTNQANSNVNSVYRHPPQVDPLARRAQYFLFWFIAFCVGHLHDPPVYSQMPHWVVQDPEDRLWASIVIPPEFCSFSFLILLIFISGGPKVPHPNPLRAVVAAEQVVAEPLSSTQDVQTDPYMWEAHREAAVQAMLPLRAILTNFFRSSNCHPRSKQTAFWLSVTANRLVPTPKRCKVFFAGHISVSVTLMCACKVHMSLLSCVPASTRCTNTAGLSGGLSSSPTNPNRQSGG